MVKNMNPFRKLKLSRNDSKQKSPEIHINSEPVVQNSNTYQSEEDVYSKVKTFLNESQSSSSETNSSISDLVLSNSSLNTNITENDIKILRRQKKMKTKLKEEGNKHIAELIAYLHSDRKLVKSNFNIEEEEYELLQSYDSAIDLDKLFEEKKSRVKDKLWRTPVIFSKRDDKKQTDLSSNGLHSVNRFGEGVADGCFVSLSLSSKGRDFGDVFHRSLEWNDIIQKADDVLSGYEKFSQKSPMTRRGSLLQPRFIFLSPHPEIAFERVLQSANCLPLRAWTSELFLDSNESSKLLDSETKRNLKWNASLEDFRHLLSPELSHFGNDVYSMLIEAKRRISLRPPQHNTKPIPFRRNSYQNGEIWSPNDSDKHQKKDYIKKLGVIQKNSGDIKVIPNKSKIVVSSQSTDSLLTVPNEIDAKEFIKNQLESNSSDRNESIELVSIENLSPNVMANELTLIAKELLLSIKSKEVIVLLIRPNSLSPETCPHIISLLGFQKRIIQLISSYVLDENDIETCAQRMAYFIEVAKELKSLRNWHSVYSVVTSLQSPPIARLRQCWQFISEYYSDTYCEFIEMSEDIKKDINPLDYTSPSIPLFNDLMDDLKERCGSKLFEIKKHRFHSNWSRRESTVAVWVDKQIVDLVEGAKNKKDIQKRVDKIKRHSKEKNKSFLKKKMSKEYSESGSGASASDSRTDSISSWNSESKVRAKLMTVNGPTPSCKNIWSVTDFNKLRECDEKEILEEIARGLIHYQKNVTYYYFNESDESARTFLLLHTYDESDVCMKKSYRLEAPKNSKPLPLPQISIN